MSLQDVTLLQGNPSIVAVFDEVVHVDTQTTTIGTKKLFIEKKRDGWKIMGEVYQPDNPEDSASESLIAVLSHLGRVHTDHKAISDLIAEWANAWSSKNIERYAACYAPDFQAREMDLKDWIHYKETLNRLYDSIQVQIEDLRIDQGPEQGTATFLQRYKSTGYQAVGIKHLELKRIGGAWKIHRETWRSIQN
jgi:ketosteroid isomerase-like protein